MQEKQESEMDKKKLLKNKILFVSAPLAPRTILILSGKESTNLDWQSRIRGKSARRERTAAARSAVFNLKGKKAGEEE